MLRLLIQTEFQYFNKYLLLAVATNVFFILALTIWSGMPSDEFIDISMLNFLIFIAVFGSEYGSQKRERLHAQLPVSHSQAFFASWFLIVILLLVHIPFWVFYSTVLASQDFIDILLETPELVLHVLVFLTVVTIGVNLFGYRPKYWAWLYSGGICFLLIGFVFLAAQELIDLEAIGFLDLLRLLDSPWDLAISSAALVLLLTLDHYIFINRENFLGG